MVIEPLGNNIYVLRDDMLAGGTKSVLMPHIIGDDDEYVYATPVYGGFQIALASYCKSVNIKATIFCAKRKVKHPNTLRCIELGARVVEVPHGYLSVVEKRARDYCDVSGATKINWGAKTDRNRVLLAQRMMHVEKIMEFKFDEVWCAVGSGLLAESIVMGTTSANVYGVQVGAEYKGTNFTNTYYRFKNESLDMQRLNILKYHKPFDKVSKYKAPFPSTPNYDLKAFEYCMEHQKNKNPKTKVLFWNVL